MRSLYENVRVTPSSYEAAGTSDVTGPTIDMAGWGGVAFICHLGTLTTGAVGSLYIQTATSSSMGDAASITGTASTWDSTMGDDEIVVVTEIYKPLERYVRAYVDRGTANAVINSMMAVQFAPGIAAVTQSTDIKTWTLVQSASEGTP